MQPIPEDILMEFNAVLKQKAVPSSIQDDYRKWLKYYLDFRVKYPPPDSKSEQVHPFIEKMRSKGKSGKDLYHAAQALSLYFSLQYRKKQAGVYADKVRAELSSELARKPLKPHPPLNLPLERRDNAIAALIVKNIPSNRPGRKYDEWWCLNKTKSPAWDSIIEKLAEEIKTRHYCRKTLKA